MKQKLTTKLVTEFLTESNAIEDVRGEQAFNDSLAAWAVALYAKEMSIGTIRAIHYELLSVLNPRIAGRFRNCNVRIGGKVKKFVSMELLRSRLQDLCDMFNHCDENSLYPDMADKFAEECHVEFEDIHPFEDGNGRVGRILWNWHRRKLGLPLKIVHADWLDGTEQRDYYKLFR
ncbi:MAG TPA: Fic family protein [Bacteroidia bacterium]|nr:Fic family protein [Bacteroidia bacterium]